MHSIVTANAVSFELPDGRRLFSDFNFTLQPKLTALVGPNGVGKTCLAKLLVGELTPASGTIRRNGAVVFFPQRQVPDAISVNEFLALDYVWSRLGEKMLAGIDRETLCVNLSGGQWMRVRLARTLADAFLILDEPTNDLDREGREALLDFLRERSGGALLISHDRECLSLCDEVIELSNRGLTVYGAGWDAYEEAKEAERRRLRSDLERAKRERELARIERHEKKERQEKRNRQGSQAAARGGMPKILLGARRRRAQVSTGKIDVETFERANEAVSDAHTAFQELKIDPVMYADLLGSEIPAQKLVAEAKGFNVRFKDWIYPKNLDFIWRGPIRMAIKGANGSGKSTLLKAVLGENLETCGEFRRGSLRSLYLDQRCAILNDSKTVFENVRERATLTESEVRNGLAKFLFTRDNVFQKVGSLSGGERLRAALAKGLLAVDKPELLILDEPTNNLDLVNIQFLESLIREFRGALLVISHDEIFLKNCEITEEFSL